MVGGKWGVFIVGRDGHELDETRSDVGGKVNEKDRICEGDVLGEFRCPLLAGDDLKAGRAGEALFGPLSEPRPDTIIFAERVAAGEDETGRLRGFHGQMVACEWVGGKVCGIPDLRRETWGTPCLWPN